MFYVLSSKNYEDTTKNYGDCILIIQNHTAILYDCGSEEHANRVIEIIKEHDISKISIILSHNDSDHFNGIPYLIEQGYVDKVFTNLLYKYVNDIENTINDHRKTPNSIIDSITKKYSNIASLSGTVILKDIYENENELPSFIKLIGPTKEYTINAVAKYLDSRESDIIDGETIANATSIQIEYDSGAEKILLTGDCSAKSLPDNTELKKYSYIQLPHHGKFETAKEIFDLLAGLDSRVTYIVSDNTGDSNGGSDDLSKNSKGHRIKNTKTNGDLISNNISSPYTGATLGYAIFNT